MNYSILLNQQDYLAEKFRYTEDHITQMSRMALLKLQSLQMVRQSKFIPSERKQEMEDFVQKTLLNMVPNSYVLSEEGYFFSSNEN
jgi:hypothetical protein